MQPIHVGTHSLEEPRCHSCHPWCAIAVAHIGELCVNVALSRRVARWVDPSEGTETLVERLGIVCVFREGAGKEGNGRFDVVDDIRLPVPGRRTCLEGAEEDVAVCVLQLGRAIGVEVGEVDDHGSVGNASRVHAEEQLEVQLFGGLVHDAEIVFEVGPGGGPASVVDGKSVNAGGLGEHHVVGVIEVRGLEGDHEVGKDHRCGRCCATCMTWVMKGIMLAGACHHVRECREKDGEDGSHSEGTHCNQSTGLNCQRLELPSQLASVCGLKFFQQVKERVKWLKRICSTGERKRV